MTTSTKFAKAYIYTTSAYRTHGWYKIGGTTKNHAIDRIEEQDSTACPEPLQKVYESQRVKGLWDDEIRKECSKVHGWVYTRVDKNREWMRAPDGAPPLTDETVTEGIIQVINSITNSKSGLKKYKPTPTQSKALEEVMANLDSLIEEGGDTIRAVADLCARFGKTLWVLELFRRLNMKHGYGTLLLPAFWLSAHSSFEKEIKEFSDFNHFVYIDTYEEGWKSLLSESKAKGLPVVVSLSLCGEASDERLSRFDVLRELDDVYLFCDEADVGAHTERSSKILDYVSL